MSDLQITWEQAQPSDYPIVQYYCYWTSLPLFNSKGKPTGERREYYMRLPYTEAMLVRRQEREWGML